MSVPNLKQLVNTNSDVFANDQGTEIQLKTFKSQEGKEGGAEVMCLESTLDQETEEGADNSYLAANRDQLLPPARESKLEECTVFINEEV